MSDPTSPPDDDTTPRTPIPPPPAHPQRYAPPAPQDYAPPAYPAQQVYPVRQSYAAPQGYGAPAYPQRRTNGLAVASLVCSIVGIVFSFTIVLGLASVAGVILGHLSLKRLKTSGEAGYGMAMAGTIIGWSGVALSALMFVMLVVLPFLLLMGFMGAAVPSSA
ncbi:DUF4190 domain-containing protein [Microbacterium lushaniae]|uniref:DUF4190 domain-containing protein n=1 Tax=Microbacterium lushaniae TaxID=2614639 RepID=A0A5J6L3Q3_9MICO|nr:DUF4190 domain-containing protein [Microbacterium lushaniae]QEW02972.1 DUF4190 domain-containing protein [Microbacterium lushaniae]